MDDQKDTDRLLSDPPPKFAVQPHHRDRSESMSLGMAPPSDDAPDTNGDAVSSAQPSRKQVDPYAEQVNTVVNSDIGVQTLLNRLKQSIASAKEFALFLKKRSILEEEHATGLRKICRITHENLRRAEHRQGSFSQSYDEITRIHERMADNGIQFAASLHQMHEDLLEMASHIERGRKHWKQTGLSAEQRLAETEAAMRKSKAKYDSIADDYDKARTGDRQSGKLFGLKGPKLEEDLLRKVQVADGDYGSKVQVAQSTRSEHLAKGRPEAIKSVQDLIKECDSALTLQMQKFATFNEKLLLHNGISVSPLKGQSGENGKEPRSLKEAVSAIDNDKDLSLYVASFAPSVPARPTEIKYERNPVLNPVMQQPVASPVQTKRQSDPQQSQSFNSRQGPPPPFGVASQQQSSMSQQPAIGQQNQMGQQSQMAQQPQMGQQSQMGQYSQTGQPFRQGGPPTMAQGAPQGPQQHERTFSQGAPPQNMGSMGRSGPGHYASPSGPPQLSSLPFQNSSPLSTSFPPSLGQGQMSAQQYSSPVQNPPQQQQNFPPPVQQQIPQHVAPRMAAMAPSGHLPPVKPVFGMRLDQLFERDGSAVPMIVYQCIQAIDLYGLEVEGIYRLSGTASHVTKIRAMFDNDASKVDFRDPENFLHDVNSVAGLLKQFFRDLPDPLLTVEHYASFIEAAKHEDETIRRDSLHAIINSLPDPNYATLRAITLHLKRVTENSSVNRMNASNLAIVFGPTLMGANTGPNIQDAGWQVRVVDTILQNTYQIFDED